MIDVRNAFPSLEREINGKDIVYLDGPGGTQVPQSVIDAISGYYSTSNANTHGAFITSEETDRVMEAVRTDISALLNAAGPECISIGQNMTSLCYSLAKGLGRNLVPGDEILITQLDHEANRGPWLSLQENGIIVREVNLLPSGMLDYADLEEKFNEKTRIAAVGWASNALGTINDLKKVREVSYRYNTLMVVDAVHYAPHFSIDVGDLGCDYLMCSSYKFYGPHMGFLYSKPGYLDRVQTDRLRTAAQEAPYNIETGTLNHAALAGVSAAIGFIASIGDGTGLREKLTSAYRLIGDHENKLAKQLFEGLSALNDVDIIGQDFNRDQRAPTISFKHRRYTAEQVCHSLAKEGICAWDGHFYAIRAIEVLDLLEKGGVTRLGISVYNTAEDIERTVNLIRSL